MDKEELKQAALEYHKISPEGKLAIIATKPMETQRDLALAYSPGVAAACEEIAQDASTASLYTARGNLLAVISKRHRGFGAGGDWSVGKQACDGGQSRSL